MPDPLSPMGLACATPNGIASVRQLFLIRAEHVIEIPEPDPLTYTVSAISIMPGTGFVEYEFDPDTVGFSSDPRPGPSGTSYTHSIRTLRQGLSRAVAEEIQKLIGSGYVAIIRTFEGEVLVVGSQWAPLTFQHEFTSGSARNDTHTNTWRLEAFSDRPAFHMDSTIEPPNEVVVPVARLLVTEAGDCLYTLAAGGSMRINGQAITALTSGLLLEYEFRYLSIVLARARIAPNANAAIAASWTLVAGSKSPADWVFEFVDRFTGTGFSFQWNPVDLGGVLPEQQIHIVLRVIESGTISLPSDTGIVFTCAPGIGTMIIERTFLID